ncbi:hypothetical protein O7602_23180 [Micromonospora sp. WMMD1128]|uniref:hypothetical protein n=1 Tax=unclassified Micromonospora TaxID=2617518 RepID=UPI00248B5CAA|nr:MULTISPECIES: hypothetical protein [unclassified Micromonospora]WBB72582.1 hypothetical protein O7602_23180 [Micromonospora sp. WMMD1128]WFE33957.1 hypothetical protein O7613_00710 [Micromonospora sp. WMMD975]
MRVRLEVLRWSLLVVAAVVLVVFLVAQRQSVEVSYGQSPSTASLPAEGSAGELSDATVPSVAEMTAMVAADPVVRLPGAVARWDEARVRAAVGDTRILVAPPGLDEAERRRVKDVENAEIRIVGTEVSGGLYLATSDDLPSWRSQFATGDVTSQIVTLLAALHKQPTPPDRDDLRWRDPTAAELAPVTAALRATGRYAAPGATLPRLPEKTAKEAFPGDAWFVALPIQPYGAPLPAYGPALHRLAPDRPLVVMYGGWIEYHGPGAAEFAEVAGASFYAQYAGRLSRYDYPQLNVLGAYLARVTDVRYAGLFDRPLPYRPLDPLRVALPALPWLFAGCVAGFVVLSIRTVRGAGRGRPGDVGPGGTPARLAGLSALAVELSLLTDARTDPALVRGVGRLRSARSAFDDGLPDKHVRGLLAGAEAELDQVARDVRMPGYRPDVYLRGRLS